MTTYQAASYINQRLALAYRTWSRGRITHAAYSRHSTYLTQIAKRDPAVWTIVRQIARAAH